VQVVHNLGKHVGVMLLVLIIEEDEPDAPFSDLETLD